MIEPEIRNLKKKISLLEWDIQHINEGSVKELKINQLKECNLQLSQLLEQNKELL